MIPVKRPSNPKPANLLNIHQQNPRARNISSSLSLSSNTLNTLDVIHVEVLLLVVDGQPAGDFGGRVHASSGLDFALDLAATPCTPRATVGDPPGSGKGGDDDERWKTNPEGGPSVLGIRQSTLHWGEDSAAGYTHNEQTSRSTSVVTETSCSQHEDDGVHDGLEEHDYHQEGDTRETFQHRDEHDAYAAHQGVCQEEERRRQE